MKKRIFSLLLCLVLCFSLAACKLVQKDIVTEEDVIKVPDTTVGDPDSTPDTTPEAQPSEEDPADKKEKTEINFAVLSGPTGVGAAQLLTCAQEDGFADVKYNVTVAADNSEIAAKLINGELDVACMASNVAASLYNKTDGGVTALCLSTLGVLYILEAGDEGFATRVDSLDDLRGETIYATGQGANPEYVLDYLLTENGVDPDEDVEIVWKTAEEVQKAMLSGEADYCMLPVPAATAVLIQGKSNDQRDVVSVLDLTEEWNKVSDDGVLTMTTVVARTEFVKENPDAVELFLRQYAESIEYVTNNVEEASVLVEQLGIVPKAAVAKLAIPDCNLVFITGEEMRDQIQGYYQVLFMANSDSLGGGIPDDAFYYGVG